MILRTFAETVTCNVFINSNHDYKMNYFKHVTLKLNRYVNTFRD